MLGQTLQFGYTMSVITLGLHQPHWPTPREFAAALAGDRQSAVREQQSLHPQGHVCPFHWAGAFSPLCCRVIPHTTAQLSQIRKVIALGKLAINFSIDPELVQRAAADRLQSFLPMHQGKEGIFLQTQATEGFCAWWVCAQSRWNTM